MRGAAQSAPGRQRVRDLRSDLPTILGGLTLASAVLCAYAGLLGFAFLLGVAQTWPSLSWVALAALAALLLSLELLFLRDYLRWRRSMAGARRG